MADTFNAKNLHGLADFFRAADFAGVHQAMETGGAGGLISRQEFPGSDAQFIAADTEGDNFGRRAVFGGIDNPHRRVRTELTDGVEDPTQGEPASFEGFGGTKYGREIFLGRLLAEQHDADGESDFGIDDAVLEELFAETVSGKRVIRGIAQIRRHPFESVEETEKVGIVVAAADLDFRNAHAMTGSKGANRCGLDRAFEVKVKLSLGKVEKRVWEHGNSLAGERKRKDNAEAQSTQSRAEKT